MAFSGHVIFGVFTTSYVESAVFELEVTRLASVIDIQEDELLSLLLGFDDFSGALLSLLMGFDDASGSLPSLLLGFDEVSDVFFCYSLFLLLFFRILLFFLCTCSIFSTEIPS